MRGERVHEGPLDSRGYLGIGWSVDDFGSYWEQEVSEKSSQRESFPGFFRFEAFTLFLGLSFAGDRLLASCFRSWISQRNSEIILALSSVRDVACE